MLIDSHCHLTKEFCQNPAEAVESARQAGVEKLICIGTNLTDSQENIQTAQRFANVYATVGIHPDSPPPSASDWSWFEKLIPEPKVVGIGECGLDWSRLPTETKPRNQEIKKQKEVFLKQIELAVKHNLPLSIHIRDAQQDVMELFPIFEKPGLRGVFHCFSGNLFYLGFIIRQLPDFYVSFAGNVTFKNAKELQDLAKAAPLSRLLLETDSPFLSPDPLRGSKNEPKNVKITAQFLANLKNVSFEELARITSENTSKLFNI